MGLTVPTRPAEAFDLAAIKNASLAELQWQETGAKTDSATGVSIIDGTFSPGLYTARVAPPGTEMRTVTMKSGARLYLPPCAGGCGAVPVAVMANHTAVEAAIGGEFVGVVRDEAVYAELARDFMLAIVVHGQHQDDPAAFGYDAGAAGWRDSFVNDGLVDLAVRNGCALVDLQTSNFGYFLARTNMLALTLALRQVEAAGLSWNGRAALSGSSKEGYAAWIVSAVDDRIQLVHAGGFQRKVVDDVSFYEYNSACGPNGALNKVDIPFTLAFRDWLKGVGTPARPVLAVADFPQGDSKPSAFILHGDVGMVLSPSYAMHDAGQFTIGQDTGFLDAFSADRVRYERLAQSPGEAFEHAWHLTIRGHMIAVLAATELLPAFDSWIDVIAAEAQDDGVTISISAQVLSAQVLGSTAVTLYWAESPNREFHDLGQTPWNAVALTLQGDRYVGAFTPQAGQQVAWLVSAEEKIAAPDGQLHPRRDSSPIRLMRELPRLSCTQLPVVCTSAAIPARSTTTTARRLFMRASMARPAPDKSAAPSGLL